MTDKELDIDIQFLCNNVCELTPFTDDKYKEVFKRGFNIGFHKAIEYFNIEYNKKEKEDVKILPEYSVKFLYTENDEMDCLLGIKAVFNLLGIHDRYKKINILKSLILLEKEEE